MIQRSPSANPAALVWVVSGKDHFRDVAPRGSGTREHQYSEGSDKMTLRALFSAIWGHFVRTSQESPRRDGLPAPAVVDLFLSYNSRDRAVVQQVRTLLAARGLSVFFDCEDLRAGLFWFEPLQQALGRVRGVVVFLGPYGLGRWQRYEMALALDRQTKEPTFPVIPVPLPGSQAGDYSGFLLLNTYADLRDELEDPDALTAIVQAVRGKAPLPSTEAAAICPYRGLNAFREEDTPLFFGRDRLVDEPEQGLLHKVLTCPLVAVVGASGSGKSSVVRAGLLPRLRREPPSRGTWDVVVFRPGKYPFLKLALALEAMRNPEASDAARETDAAALDKSWSRGDLPLEVSLGQAREVIRVDRLLVIVDQFEELITLTPKEARLPFLSRLLGATGAESKITVLLTLRADYYSAIYLDPRLSDSVQRGLVNVRAMTRDERRAAIEGPARRVGLEFESGLVDQLLDDVGDEPGNLPLLEFALTALWERREGRRLTNSAYKALGRVAGAIGRHADAVFDSLTDEQKAAAPRLFGRLVRVTDVDEEGRNTRERVRLGDLDEASRSAVEPFVAGRLLVTARDPGLSVAKPNPDDGSSLLAPDDPTTVEVAHEALIRTWDRLRGWIKEDRAFLLWRQRLGFHIAEWERSGYDERMLPRGALLKEAEGFNSRWDDINKRERVFLTWTQTVDYQIKRIEKEGPNLIGLCDNPDTISRWLRALALIRGVNEVITNASVIEGPGKWSAVLCRVAEALAQAGLADQAKDAALQAKDAALRIEEPSDRSHALSAVAAALAQAGLADQAKDAALQAKDAALRIEKTGMRLEALRSMAAALAQAGLADQAKDAALRIERPGMRSHALSAVAAALAQAGLADQAKDAALRIEEPGERWQALHWVAVAQAGLADQAKDAALRIEEPGERWQVLCWVAAALAQAGLADQAKDAALQAKDAALRIERPGMRSHALSAVAAALAQAGLADQAKDAALQAKDAALRSEKPWDRSHALYLTAEALAQAGLADQAKDAALRIEEPGERWQALHWVAVALAQAGLADQAKDAALRIEEPGMRWQVLCRVAEALAQAGLADQAKDAALQAKDAALRSEKPGMRPEVLRSVVEVLLSIGLIDDSREVASTITDPQLRSAAFASVAGAIARAHKFQLAHEVTKSCIRPESKLDAFTTILIEYTKMTKPELAKVLGRMVWRR